MARLLSIGEAAEQLGVSDQTLRTWERKGILKAIRLPSGYRRFTQEEVERMKRQIGLLPAAADPAASGEKAAI